MQLRSFILLGFCAVLGMSSAAFAGTPAMVSQQSVGKTDVINVAAAKSDAAQLKLLKKKKNPSADDLAQISKLEAKIAADKASRSRQGARSQQAGDARGGQSQGRRGTPGIYGQEGQGGGNKVADAKPGKKTIKIIEPVRRRSSRSSPPKRSRPRP